MYYKSFTTVGGKTRRDLNIDFNHWLLIVNRRVYDNNLPLLFVLEVSEPRTIAMLRIPLN